MQTSKVIRIVLVALLLFCVFFFTDLDAIWSAMKRLTWEAFAICVFGELLFYAVECFRLHFLSKKQFTPLRLFSTRLLCAFVGTFLPGAISGEVLRVFLLGQDKRMSKFNILLLLLANRLYGVVALASVLFFALVFTYPVFPIPSPPGIQLSIWITCLIVIVSPLAFNYRLFRRMAFYFLLKTKGKVKSVVKSVLLAAVAFTKPGTWLIATVTSMISNSIVVAEFWFIGSQLGLDVSFASWCVWIAFVAVASFLPLGIGALGPQETAMLLGASVLRLPAETVLAVSLVIHAVRFGGATPGILWAGDLSDLGKLLKRIKKISAPEVP